MSCSLLDQYGFIKDTKGFRRSGPCLYGQPSYSIDQLLEGAYHSHPTQLYVGNVELANSSVCTCVANKLKLARRMMQFSRRGGNLIEGDKAKKGRNLAPMAVAWDLGA